MVWHVYRRWLHKYPARTKITSGGCVVGLGDVACQQFVENRSLLEHDVARSLKAGAIGCTLVAPWNFIWLDKVLPRVTVFSKRSAVLNACAKVGLDMAISAPVVCTRFQTFFSFS